MLIMQIYTSARIPSPPLVMQQVDQQDTQSTDCEGHADQKHNASERVLSPAFNAAPPLLLLASFSQDQTAE